MSALLVALGCTTYSEESRRGEGEDEGSRESAAETDPRDEGEASSTDEEEEPGEADENEEEQAVEQAPEGQGEMKSTMHRENAGDPDESGWYQASSKNGGFEVEVPAAFNDYQVSPDEAQTMHVVQANKGDVRYLVQCSAGGEPPEQKLEAIEEQLPQLGEVKQRQRVRHAGFDGVEFRLTGGENTTVTIRTLVVEDMLCQLIVEAQNTSYPEREGARFMESFAVTEN